MQKSAVFITNNRIFTFHNVSFSAVDSTDFMGFCIFSLDFEKTENMEPSEIEFLRAPCFFVFWKSKKNAVFGFFNTA